jgi:hypothetical protein
MADYTEMRGYIYAVPDTKWHEAAEVLAEYGVLVEAPDRYRLTDPDILVDAVVNGWGFFSENFRCGDTDDLGDKLEALRVVFEIWEEPKYEWLGELTAYHPDLGRLSRQCDADGEIVCRVGDIFAIENRDEDPSMRWLAVRELFGIGWIESFRTLTNPPPLTVVKG